MGRSVNDVVLTEDWVDIAALPGYSGIVNKKTTVQAKYVAGASYIFIGGNTPPSGDNGLLFLTGTAVTQTSDHWWVKGKGRLAVLIEE